MWASSGIGRAASSGRSLLVPAMAGPKGLEERGAHKRGRHVRPVVDVLSRVGHPAAAHQAYRIDLEEDGSSAASLARLRVEDVSLADGQVHALGPVGVLVQQVAEIRGRPVCRRDGQEQIVRSFPGSPGRMLARPDYSLDGGLVERRLAGWPAPLRLTWSLEVWLGPAHGHAILTRRMG